VYIHRKVYASTGSGVKPKLAGKSRKDSPINASRSKSETQKMLNSKKYFIFKSKSFTKLFAKVQNKILWKKKPF
jgi:hypothetical protein